MKFDVVRGKITKPAQCNQLIDAVKAYMGEKDETGTLYLGYPLTANEDEAITVEALWITKEKGMIAFIFGNSQDDPEKLKEDQDALYYNIDFYLKKYSDLRKGRNLVFTPLVITLMPNNTEISDADGDYIFCQNDEIASRVEEFDGFDKTYYEKLCEILQKVSKIKPRKKRSNVKKQDSFGAVIKKIESEIANLDQWQKKAALEIPEGPQRIRGLAGSGKTIVLAWKAAYLYTQFPELKIGVTYYTRTLNQQYVDLISDFVQDMAGEQVDWEKLDVIHAWGSNSEEGIYSNIAKKAGFKPYNLTSAIAKFGRSAAFKGCCDELLIALPDSYEPEYDVLLIDEAQDMPSSFFQLVFRNVKEPKRIIWAYDELQNLTDVEMPSLEEMFGTTVDGGLNINIENRENEPKRDIPLPVCYRNPPWTLALAHALGFGLYHEPIIQSFDDPKEWLKIGYTIKSGELTENSTVQLARKKDSAPEYFENLLDKQDSVKLKKFNTKEEQYAWVAREIRKNISDDELEPDDILVVFPDTYSAKGEYKGLKKYLNANGVETILSGVDTDRDIFRVKGFVTCAHVYRAKGNEAPMVYVVNTDYCAEGMELIKLRNILFTSITRSRAWVRICGIGKPMEQIQKEYDACVSNNYELQFRVLTSEELKNVRRVNRERTELEKKMVEDAKTNINELIRQLEQGTIDSELIPELKRLINLVGK